MGLGDFFSGIGDFLGGVSNTAKQVVDIASPVYDIYSAIRGKPAQQSVGGSPRSLSGLEQEILKRSTERGPTLAEQQASELYKMLIEPDSPLLQRLSQEEAAAGMDAFRRGIRSQVLAQRREQAAGRAPVFFDPERRDEAISYMLSRGLPQAERYGRSAAQQRVLQAAGGLGSFSGAQAQRYAENLRGLGMQNLLQQQPSQYGVGIQQAQPQGMARVEGLIGGIDKLVEALRGTSSRTPSYNPGTARNVSYLPSGEYINWNAYG